MAKFAIMGHGTLGSGLAEVARVNRESIAAKVGEEITVKYILDIREFPDSPDADKFIKDFAIIENDPEVEVVVETIGGTKVAQEFTRRALMAGKHVVTANKELVATYGKDLLAIAAEKNVNYLFEASVGGAIPLLRPLFQCMAGNQIEEIAGILNGTTNYILTRMVQDGASFADALKEAQAKGYAEADPTADVEGIDAGRKICILSNLAWGKEVAPANVRMIGISALDLKDVDIAASAGYRVKLLGHAMRMAEGKVAAYVAPHLVPESSPLSRVDDVFNACLIRGNAADEVMFYGRGAGKPTASALMGDVIDAIQHREKRRDLGWSESADLFPSEELVMQWYLRGDFSAADAKGVCGEVKEAAPGAVITAPMTEVQAKAAAEKLGAEAVLRVL
ncbi:MAG: homoserine dehydrogenase [Ruminococcaceae bacterium]|nr:homoserine dehydrogenase [Oscillospiraceae bacterium]